MRFIIDYSNKEQKMNLQVKYYQESDYNDLVKLLDESFGTMIRKDVLEEHYVNDTHNIILAKTQNGEMCGCALFEKKIDYIRDNPVLFISFLAVDERYRRNGIGKLLMEHLELICEQMGCSAIELTSADWRIDAHRFYNAIGFSRKKTTVFIKEICSKSE